MGSPPVKKHHVPFGIQCSGICIAKLIKIKSSIVVCPVIEMSAGEVAERPSDARSHVVPISGFSRFIVVIHRNGCEWERAVKVDGVVVTQPIAEHFKHAVVFYRMSGKQYTAIPRLNEPQSFTLHVSSIRWNHIFSRAIPPEVPQPQQPEDVVARYVCLLQYFQSSFVRTSPAS